jgi:phosphoribosylamine---glycine ligase
MRILLLGSGGREHALAWKMVQSPLCEALFVAPGNAGTRLIAQNAAIDPNDFEGIAAFIKQEDIRLLVVGPEEPLVRGVRDYLEADPDLSGLLIVGPGRDGARLEGSKDYAKAFMNRQNIPTAQYMSFNKTERDAAREYLAAHPLPVVLKADGLAAGKGVIICHTLEHALESLDLMILESAFGAAGDRVVIEEFLSGIELSVFVLTDGKDYLLLPEAKDYKTIGENNTGPNTGGMGSVSPVPFASGSFMKKVEERVIIPTVQGLAMEGIPYRGFVFFGLIRVGSDPYVIEYNVRMGDPETQAVLPRINGDLVEALIATARGQLGGQRLTFREQPSATVVMVSEGYPGPYAKGRVVHGLDSPAGDALIFHAGTAWHDQTVVTNGGRVIAVTGNGDTLQAALEKAYSGVQMLHWEGHYYRRDIGLDLMASI